VNRLDLPWIRQRLAEHRARPIDAPRRAAVAAIFRASGTGGCDILFILRAKQEQDPWSGHMAFPGGRIEEHDATPLDAARRETREEVGIDLSHSGELLGQLDDLQASAGGRVVPLSITPFVFALEAPLETVPNEEVEEIHWIPVPKLLDPASASTVPYVLAGQRYELPCFRVFDRVIWGLTYQMLMLLFSVLDWEVEG
jgi:8-oxo-dGTP pyrophosphatase MutT (NUDIX family)